MFGAVPYQLCLLVAVIVSAGQTEAVDAGESCTHTYHTGIVDGKQDSMSIYAKEKRVCNDVYGRT